VNTKLQSKRYSGIAVGLHWLIAVLIVGMLAAGKWMTSLELDNPLRFIVTQWHKSFGITILILSLFRLYWRARHPPPALSQSSPQWELKAASTTHIALYFLLIGVPLSGWLLVSASPLNLPTLLFNIVPWPHVPGLSHSETTESWFLSFHHFTANLMMALLLLHVAAALRHHFIKRDDTLSRMSVFDESGRLATGLIPLILGILVISSGLYGFNRLKSPAISATIGAGEVRFTAVVMGQDLIGQFQSAEVEVLIDPDKPNSNVLNATVLTDTLQSSDSQVQETLKDIDWFDVSNYPQALFKSSRITHDVNAGIQVSGTLTIKEVSKEISFPVTINNKDNEKYLSGSFTINRLDYKVGAIDQPDDSYAGFNVLISFVVEL